MSTEVAVNPFSGAVAQSVERMPAPIAIEQQRAVAEVQAAMMIARTNPRDPARAMDRILNACTRPALANAAVYQYSRGGSDISGPSIRLAEVLAQQWGNLHYGVRELDQRNGESTVQAFCWDVETGTRREMTFQVPHVRHTKKGAYKLEDPRDIYEMVANQGARRLRACILGVIPGDVTEEALKQCEMTMHAKADISQEAVTRMAEEFAKYGVNRQQIEARIQRRLDAIQPAQVVSLRKIFASLRDGISQASDWFDVPQSGTTDAKPKGVEGALDKIKKRSSQQEAVEQLQTRIDAAADPETLRLELDVLRSSDDDGHKAERVAIVQRRLEQLTEA